MREELPRKKMSLWGPMGLSMVVHGLLVVGAGYLGYRSLPQGESVSEMEFGAETSAAPATVPLEVDAKDAPPVQAEPPPPVNPPLPHSPPPLPESSPPPPVVVTPSPKTPPAPPEPPRPEAPPPPAVIGTVPVPVAPPPQEVSEATPEPSPTPAPKLAQPTEPAAQPSVEPSLEPQEATETAPAVEPESLPETRADLPPEASPLIEAVSESDSSPSGQLPPAAAGLPEGVISDSQLSPVRTARPDYPIQDKLKGHQGDVVLLYSLKSDGSVTNIRIFKSSGHRSLDLSAAKALAQYRYPEGRVVEVIKTFSFRLKGPSVETPSRWRK